MSPAVPRSLSRLILGHHQAQLQHDPVICADHISQAVPVHDFVPIHRNGRYQNRTYSLALDGVAISNGQGTPFAMAVAEQPRPSLLLCLGGQASIQLGGHCYSNSPDQPLLFLPGEPFGCTFHQASALIMSFEPSRLARTAMAMAEKVQLDGLNLQRLQDPLAVDTGTWLNQHLSRLLHTTLQLLDHALENPQTSGPPGANFSELLTSQMAGFLYPCLLEAPGQA